MQTLPARALSQLSRVAAKSRPGGADRCNDCNLAASGMLDRGREPEGEEMVGPFAKRNAAKD